MKLGSWLQKRSPSFILKRGLNLMDRYGLSSHKAMDRVLYCLESLISLGCTPTFPVPGMVLDKHPVEIKRVQDLGAEIAVHGYNHVDFKAYSAEEGLRMLMRGAEAFSRHGIKYQGFRCPYLSCTDNLIKVIPENLFDYSSNRAIRWPIEQHNTNNIMVNTIDKFYSPLVAIDNICIPWFQDQLVEIPVCVPDDLQLMDGYQLNSEEVADIWIRLLDQVHSKGELLNLMFHPELGYACDSPFEAVLKKAAQKSPAVWIASLREVSHWWKEKSGFKVDAIIEDHTLRLQFNCSHRATILMRGIDCNSLVESLSCEPWYGNYQWVHTANFRVPVDPIPLIGVSQDVSPQTIELLTNYGYIIELTDHPERYSIYVDAVRVLAMQNDRQLIEWIENSFDPLIRLGAWPDGARAAMCITGDLDALSLLDYSSRLWTQ